MKHVIGTHAARLAAATTLLVMLLPAASWAGDAFFRGGVILHPRDLDLKGRWRLDFGSDYPVNFAETVYVGFEIQTSVFRQDVIGSDRTATLFPANSLINVKYKAGDVGVRPYGGGGMGLLSTFILLSGNNDWVRDFGFQLVGGVELGRLSLELQLQRAFESGSDTAFGFYAGLVW